MTSTSSPSKEHLQLSFSNYVTKNKHNMFPSEISLQDCKISLLPERQKSHFAIDGPSFALIRSHDRKLLQRVVLQGTIFARMLPEQKIHLVEALQELGFQVGMCGDGANDCGALKVAHAGVSLCEAEASIASPFTSKKNNILCVPRLISEGRAALVSCIGVFKYEVAYCFSMLFAALMLFWDALKMSDAQYIYIDMILNIFPAIAFGMVGPCSRLSKKHPEKKLFAFVPLTSIFSFLIIQLIFYVIVWNFCHSQPWFVPYSYVRGTFFSSSSYAGTAMFQISLFSYFIAVIIFSEGAPFRKPLYYNHALAIFLFGTFVSSTFIIISPGKLEYALTLKQSPYVMYHVVIFGLAMMNCMASYAWEIYLVRTLIGEYVVPWLRKHRGPSTPYEKLEKELSEDANWPPTGTKSFENVSDVDEPIVKKGCLQELPLSS